MSGKSSLTDKIIEKVENDYRDIDIEYMVIAYILRIKPSLVVFFKSEWFTDIILKAIFSVILALRIVLPKKSLFLELKRRSLIGQGETEIFKDTLSELYSMDLEGMNDKTLKHLAEQLLELYESRKVLIGCSEVLSSINNFKLHESKKKLESLSKQYSVIDFENNGYYLDDFNSRLEIINSKLADTEDEDDGNVGIPTGIYRFDKICGGIMRKEFGVIGGVPGVGKTLALVNFALTAWNKGYNVMIASGEMSKSLLEFRIDSNISDIPAIKFRNADLTSKEIKKWSNTIKKYKADHSSFLYISTYPRRFSISDIERDLLFVQDESGSRVDAIFVDYLNIIGKKGDREWTAQADIVWDFKGLVSEYNLVGWTAGQVVDDAFDKELYDLSDLKYARAISETAPVVVALIQTDRDRLENRMKFQILKMRNAPVPNRPIILVPNMDYMRLHEEINIHTLRDKLPDTLRSTRKRIKK